MQQEVFDWKEETTWTLHFGIITVRSDIHLAYSAKVIQINYIFNDSGYNFKGNSAFSRLTMSRF